MNYKNRIISVNYNEAYDHQLRDREYVAAYLHAALEESMENFIFALREVERVNCSPDKTNYNPLQDLGIKVTITTVNN